MTAERWASEDDLCRAAQRQEVVHYCERPLPVGAQVEAVLDWQARLDHIQRHAGEHILSHAVWKLFGANNIGFIWANVW